MKLAQLQEARYFQPSSSFAAFVVDALQVLNPGDEPKCLDEKDKIKATTLQDALNQLVDAFGHPNKKSEDVPNDYTQYEWRLGKYVIELFTYGMVGGERYVGLCVSPEDNVNV